MNAIILGDRSDIAVAMSQYLRADGWTVDGWHRGAPVPFTEWDLCLIAIGQVKPVGLWHEQIAEEWDSAIEANVLLPVRLLRHLWTMRRPNAYVCFMAGSNPNAIMAGYSAYNTGKMALLKCVEQLDAESPDCTMFALGPGVTDTKIHNATKEAGWPNPRLERALKDGSFTPQTKIYECLKWCLSQPKQVVGGRNVCVSDPYGPGLSTKLKHGPALFKLRRIE